MFINFDRDMRDPKTREWARCRNSNLNEDLGKVGRGLGVECTAFLRRDARGSELV